jgi:predicted phage replisome organizer
LSEIHWVKLSTEMFNDEKIKVIRSIPSGAEACLTWIHLIVLAGRTNDNGMIYLTKSLPYTDDMLAKIFDQPVETVRMALAAFLKLEMIEISKDNLIVLVNWEKYQNIDGMDRVRRLTAERVKRSREKQRLLGSATCSATVTLGNAIDSDSDSDSDSEEEKKTSTSSVPPLSTRAVPKPKLFYSFDESLWYGIDDAQVALWAEAYPAVDIDLELRQMGEWCKSNGARGRKHDWRKFIVNWLKRSQDRGGSVAKGEGGWKKKQYSR